MDDLATYERRLAKEREENSRLESRLIALRASADASIDRFGPKQPASAPVPSFVQQPSSATPDANVLIQQLAAIQASLEAAQHASNSNTRQRSDDNMSVTSGRGRTIAPSGKSVVSVGARSAGGRSVRSTSSSVRQGTGGRQSAVPDVATPSVVYRSSMYRSVSPSKRATNGVVVSSFARGARFQEDRQDVPGPGKYDPHSTDFRPVAVPVGSKIDDGNLGHTHSMYRATTGTGITPAQDHHNRMAYATARVPLPYGSTGAPVSSGSVVGARMRSPEPGDRNLDALSPGTVGSSVSRARPSYGIPGGINGGASTIINGGAGGDGIEGTVVALLNAHHGDPRSALAASVRKEKALRKEVQMMRETANGIRMNAGQLASNTANSIEGLQDKLIKKDKALANQQAKLKGWSDLFLRADQTMSELNQWMSDAQGASQGRNPALGRAADAARQLHAIIESAHSLMAPAAYQQSDAMSESGSVAQGGAGAQGGFMAYSSLSAALSNPFAGDIGTIGQSNSMLTSQVNKQRTVAAGPPVVPARDRGLTGAQAAGLGLSSTAAQGVSAADIQSRPTATTPSATTKGLSAADIRAFARTAAEAMQSSDGGIVAATAHAHAHASAFAPSGGRSGSIASVDPYEGAAQAALARITARMPAAPQAPQQQVSSPSAGSKAGAGAQGSVQGRLQALFAYYSGSDPSSARGGQGQGSGMRQADFMRLLGDSGALGGGGEYGYEAQNSFLRALASTGLGSGGNGNGANGEALSYDAWVVALTDFACRRAGQYPPGSDPNGLLVSPEAFRKALDTFLMPLAAHLKASDPSLGNTLLNLGAARSAGAGAPSNSRAWGSAAPAAPVEDSGLRSMLSGFAEAFLRPDVLSFFNDHRGALQGLFNYYVTQGGSGSPANALNRRALLAWAGDVRVCPDMLAKNELLQLAREVTHAVVGRSTGGSPDRDVALSYPEWCELVGLIAHVTVGAAHAQSLLNINTPSMLQKLQLLIVDLSMRGAVWPQNVAPEAQRMVRNVEGSLREQAGRGQEDPTRSATRAAMQRFSS